MPLNKETNLKLEKFNSIDSSNASARAGLDTRPVFKADLNRFEFRSFLLWDQLSYQYKKPQATLLFTYFWRENSRMDNYLNSISAMKNANILVKDLKSGRFVHFQRRLSLHNYHLNSAIVMYPWRRRET